MEEGADHSLAYARRAGLRREAAAATSSVLLALACGPTPVEDAISRAEQALADFDEEQRPGEGMLALLYGYAGRAADAERALERARDSRRELGQPMSYATASINVGFIALLADKPEEAEQELRAAAELLEAAPDLPALSIVAAVLAEVLYRLGRDAEAEEWTRRSEQVAPPESVLSQALWRSTRAKVLARRGEPDQAMSHSAQAVELAGRSDDLRLLGDCVSHRAEVLRLLGRADEAPPFLEEALAAYERKGIIPSIKRTRALLGGIAA
jgi:tetratricopeptide (TPR) repeat protein